MVVFYREWARRLNDRKANFITLEDMECVIKYVANPGFMSLYAFSEEDALSLKATGVSRGYDQYTPASDFLAIDIDDGDEGLVRAEAALSKYEYSVWTSGSKGYHIILPHDFLHDKRLPNSHKEFVDGLGIKYDASLYQAGRIFRLPNCIHQKTGKKKVKLRDHAGVRVEISLKEKPKVEFTFQSDEEGDVGAALGRLWSLGTVGAEEGSRNTTVWGVAVDLINAGFEADAVVSFLQTINSTWSAPLPEEEVELAVRSAIRKIRG
jgi:hypothetical protein